MGLEGCPVNGNHLIAKRNSALLLITVALLTASLVSTFSVLTLIFEHLFKFDRLESVALFTVFAGLLYCASIVGGMVGGRVISYVSSIQLGVAFSTFGLLGLYLSTFFGSVTRYEISIFLSFLLVGYGLISPCVMAVFGEQAKRQMRSDERSHARFILNYMAINIGGLIAIGFSGFWSTPELSRHKLLISLFLLILVAISFNQASKRMDFLGPDFLLGKLEKVAIGVILVLTVFSVSVLMLSPLVADVFLLVLVVFTVGYVLSCAKKIGQSAFRRMLIFVGMTSIAIFFFILYSLEPDVLAIFIHDYVNRRWLGMEIPASTYFMLNPFFNLLFGSLFFICLTRFKKSFSPDSSIYFSIFLIGFGFWVLWISTLFFKSGGISTWWIVTVYALLGLAEMLLAPIAYEIVFIYGFRGLYGMMMGLSQLSIGIGAMLAERVSKFIVPAGYAVTPEALHFFAQGFKHVGLVWMGIGLLLMSMKMLVVFRRK